MKNYRNTSSDMLLGRFLSEKNSDSDNDSSTSEEFITRNHRLINQVERYNCLSDKKTLSSTEELSDYLSETSEECSRSDKQNKKSKNFNRIKRSAVSDTRNLQRNKKKRNNISICSTNCRYAIVRQVAFKCGLKDASEDDSWDLYWTDTSFPLERAKEMKRFQKINHFPGMWEISRKDLLARNLNKMMKIFPTEYNFFPKTWCLPADYNNIINYSRKYKNRTYICKPDAGSRGRGIYLTKHIKDIKPYEKMICQVYISRPLLVDGYKFDLRIYVLITSCDPLRIFVYNDGLVRLATCRYQEPTSVNVTNVFMHLTNYSVNKHSRTFVKDSEAGSKRKISTMNIWFENNHHNVTKIWSSIDEMIVKTVISAHSKVKHNYHTYFPNHDGRSACFELLGFDILLDNKLRPYLLEVNHSPSYHTETQTDKEVKEQLLADTFRILNLGQIDKKKIMEEDRRRMRERLLHGIYNKDGTALSSSGVSDPFMVQTEWEDGHMGNFRRIYPTSSSAKYDVFIYQNQISFYQNTTSSKAREISALIQREEREEKMRVEVLRRVSQKIIKRPCSESPSEEEKTLNKKLEDSVKYKNIFQCDRDKRDRDNEKYMINCFNSLSVINKDETERKFTDLRRDLSSCHNNVKDVVRQVILRNGALNKNALMRYGLYNKVRDANHETPTTRSNPCCRKVSTITLQPHLLTTSSFPNSKQISMSEARGMSASATSSASSILSLGTMKSLKSLRSHIYAD